MMRDTGRQRLKRDMQKDILVGVFEYLDLLSLAMATRCCRLWARAASAHEHLYEQLDFTGFGPFVPDQLLNWHLRRYGERVKSVVLQNTPLTLGSGIGRASVAMVPRINMQLRFPHLQVVDATRCSTITADFVQHLLMVAPKLRTFAISPHCAFAQDFVAYAPQPDVVGDALVQACRSGNAQEARRLLEIGANVHYLSREQGIAPPVMCKVTFATPLHASVVAGHLGAVEQLMRFGADVMAVCACDCNICLSHHVTTPLQLAQQFAELYPTNHQRRLILELLTNSTTVRPVDGYPSWPLAGLPVAVYCQIAHTLRRLGNAYFSSHWKFETAAHYYCKALRYLRAGRPDQDGAPQPAAKHGLLSCLANLAACELKLERYDSCLVTCDELLRLDPGSVKGLYRRGLALTKLDRVPEALLDLNAALLLAPDSAEVRNVIESLGVVTN
eukprot:TRINITY_DN24525_c0_g1_i1.p1 TRINITY_DN24525_c0_g1~~TRINITY_DN24525_c0_g1_i1.p1  ORF type:complete len:455 (+),score=68.70 TRINITY_DN24525_c0_g1_i1:34-1365(+)